MYCRVASALPNLLPASFSALLSIEIFVGWFGVEHHRSLLSAKFVQSPDCLDVQFGAMKASARLRLSTEA